MYVSTAMRPNNSADACDTMVTTKLDYCNAALAGLPQSPLGVQNSAGHLIFEMSIHKHATACLYSYTGYQYAGTSSSNFDASCTQSSMGHVERI